MPGTTALELVRARHLYYQKDGEWVYDGQSDFSRIQRQDAFFRAVLQKLNASITNPIAINSFIGAAVSNLTIDDTMSESDLFHLAEELHGLPESSLHTETLPTYSFTTSGGAAVLGEAQPYANDMVLGFNLAGTSPPPPDHHHDHHRPGAHHHHRAFAPTILAQRRGAERFELGATDRQSHRAGCDRPASR